METTTKDIEFVTVQARYGSAGGSLRKMAVTLNVEGYADTVESVRQLVKAAPDLAQALSVAIATIERLNRHNSANGTLDVCRAALRAAGLD